MLERSRNDSAAKRIIDDIDVEPFAASYVIETVVLVCLAIVGASKCPADICLA